MPLQGLPDKSKLTAGPAPGWAWDALRDAAADAFQHLGVYLPNELLEDLLDAQPGRFLYADLDVSGIGIKESDRDGVQVMEELLRPGVHRGRT